MSLSLNKILTPPTSVASKPLQIVTLHNILPFQLNCTPLINPTQAYDNIAQNKPNDRDQALHCSINATQCAFRGNHQSSQGTLETFPIAGAIS